MIRQEAHPRLLKLVVGLLLALNLMVVSHAENEQADDDVSAIPQRPFSQILDSARWLTLSEKDSTQKELSRLLEENQIDVFLVTRSEQPPQGAQTYARKLGEAWSKAPVWCVVFHVPGDPSGFHVEAGGVEINRQKIDKAVNEASKRARRETTEKDRVMSAWKECSESLRFLHASGQRHTEQVVEVKKGMRAEIVEDKLRFKVIMAAVVIGLIVCVVIAYFFILLMRKQSYSFEFPETTWRTRFQGPHSGGSGIVVNYRSKQLK